MQVCVGLGDKNSHKLSASVSFFGKIPFGVSHAFQGYLCEVMTGRHFDGSFLKTGF